MRWISGFQLALAGAGLLLAHALSDSGPRSSFMTGSAQVTGGPPPAPLRSSRSLAPEAENLATSEFFVMIDPSHGGDDHGTVLPGKVQEKDLTLTLARELRRELEEDGIHARLLRESDLNVDLERRAETANAERAGIYLALHAGSPGKGVRVYTAALPSLPPAGPQKLLSWGTAQAPALEKSRALARAVCNELRKTDLPVTQLTAPLRPLNNVVMPAISLEWVPEADELKPQQSSKIMGRLASAIASGIVHAAGSLGVRQ